jgi:hypothetical protein
MTVVRILLLLAMGVARLMGGEGNRYMPPADAQDPPGASVRAAAAVLLQLEMAIDGSAINDPGGCMLNAGHETMSRGDCALQLASMPKPVRCRGSVRDGVLSVDCQRIESAFVRLSGESFVRELSEQYGGVDGHARLLVKGRHDRMILTAEEAAEMFHNYNLFFVSRHLREPDDSERAQGATAVLDAHASHAGTANVTVRQDSSG